MYGELIERLVEKAGPERTISYHDIVIELDKYRDYLIDAIIRELEAKHGVIVIDN